MNLNEQLRQAYEDGRRQGLNEQVGPLDPIIAQSGMGAAGNAMWQIVMMHIQMGNYPAAYRLMHIMMGAGVLTAQQYIEAVGILDAAIAGATGTKVTAAVLAGWIAMGLFSAAMAALWGYSMYLHLTVNHPLQHEQDREDAFIQAGVDKHYAPGMAMRMNMNKMW